MRITIDIDEDQDDAPGAFNVNYCIDDQPTTFLIGSRTTLLGAFEEAVEQIRSELTEAVWEEED